VSGALKLEPVGGVAEIRAEWSALAEASGNPFMTPEWCEAWLEHVRLDVRLRLFAARREEGTLAALVPLVVTRGRYVRKARFLGFGPANELGPVAGPTDREEAAEALRQALAATRNDWDVFLGEYLVGEGWAELVGGSFVAQKANPVLRGSWSSWDDYLATRSSGFRQELRRKERRLAQRGLAYRVVSEPSQLERGLDVLFELHRARWGDSASRWFAGREAFQRAFSRKALERGWLRLCILELDGRPAAAYHGFRFVGSEWSYQFGRDPSEERSSVGLIIAADAVRRSLEEGATEFRLGPGAQQYKLRFATGDLGLETIGIARGLRGRASLLAARRRGGA
jgi:CelD/BcsL family acetyltransferase involved in cellulose biosynthesis